MSTYFPAAVSLTDMPTGEGWENNSIMLKASESCGLWYEMKESSPKSKLAPENTRSESLIEMTRFCGFSKLLHKRIKDQSHFHMHWVLRKII